MVIVTEPSLNIKARRLAFFWRDIGAFDALIRKGAAVE
jgi:hypothetical protein